MIDDGRWWALGAVGAVAIAGAVRRGSRADEPARWFSPGDVLVPAGATYPERAIEVVRYDGDDLIAFEIGGGFQLRFPPERVAHYGFTVAVPARKSIRMLGKESTEPPWRPGRFNIGGDDPTYPGYTQGYLWNGWATPAFERDVAQRVLEGTKAAYGPGATEFDWIYDPAEDCFWTWDVYQTSQEPDDPIPPPSEAEEGWTRWGAFDIEVDGQIKHVYGIGAYYWIWDEEE